MDVVEGAAAAAASQPTSQSTPSVTVTAPTTTSPSPSKKRSLLTLDLNGPTAGQSQASSTAATLTIPAGVDFRPSPGFVLTSPDVQMLQLASPELEKYIIQGLMGQNTPTPTKLVFPQNVTEEQESYAKGFVDALNALHRSGMAYNVVTTPGQGNGGFPINGANGQNLFPQFFTMPNQQQFLQPQLMQHPGPQGQPQQQQQPIMSGPTITMQLQQPKVEPYSPSVSPAPSDPQTVPSDGGDGRGSSKSSSATNSTSGHTATPLNMANQSKMKQERKRERNRLAAAKCRTRKLERIAQLEERVKELKEQNAALADTGLHLRGDLASLKQELVNHLQSGCGLELPQHILHCLQQHQQQAMQEQ